MENEKLEKKKEEVLMCSLSDTEREDRQSDKEIEIGLSKKPRAPNEMDIEKYYSLFFKIPTESARKGKSVYLRQEHHHRFNRLISTLGIEKLTIYAYVDNIIEHHFNKYEELISFIYQQKDKPLF